MHLRLQGLTIDGGDAGIQQTVRAMLALMQQGARLPIVRQTAALICAQTMPGVTVRETGFRYAAAIRQWVAAHWEFLDDPVVAELLYGPDAQLSLIAQDGVMRADCDDAAILVGALGLAAGLIPRVICVGFLTSDSDYTHTWTELQPPLGAGVWIEADVTRPMQAIPVHQIGRAAAWEIQT